jgi:peptidyl-prolyl cis-trans isomerase C
MTAALRTVISVNGRVMAGGETTPRNIETDVSVNGETVERQVIAREIQNHHAPKGKPGTAWQKAANAVAIRTLLLQEARRRQMTAEAAEVAPGRFETEEEALIRSLVETAITVSPPREDAVRTEWERDPSRFRSAPLWEVSHILVRCDPRDKGATATARTIACDLAERALREPAGFARLAARHSDCGSKASGGALGQLRPGDTVPEFEAALRGLREGEITAEPVLTRHGWHVIRMDALADGAVLPYEAARAKVAEAMEKAAWVEAAREFVAGLVASAEITGAGFGGEDGGARDAQRSS